MNELCAIKCEVMLRLEGIIAVKLSVTKDEVAYIKFSNIKRRKATSVNASPNCEESCHIHMYEETL